MGNSIKLVKLETYTFDQDNQLIKFSDGNIERFFGKTSIRERNINHKTRSMIRRPPIDLSIKPVIKLFGIIFDFTNLEQFHHMFVKKDDKDESSIQVFDKSNKTLSEIFVTNLGDDVIVYSFDYLKKTLFIYTKSGNRKEEVTFKALPKEFKSHRLVTDKYPVAYTNKNLQECNSIPIHIDTVFGMVEFKSSLNYGYTHIYLPKDEIERKIYCNHIIYYDIVHTDEGTIVSLKYLDTKNRD